MSRIMMCRDVIIWIADRKWAWLVWEVIFLATVQYKM